MNDLWVIGVVGGGAGAAVGAPLLFIGRRRGAPWTPDQLVGLWLVGAAVALILVGVRHGQLLTPGWDLAVEIITDAMSLAAWTTLVSLTRRIAGDGDPIPVVGHLILPALYVVAIAAMGFPDVPFLWLLPVGVASVGAIGLTWRRARTTANAVARRHAGAVFAFSTLFCLAQGIRSIAPNLLQVREIVPTVLTLSIFAIAIALRRGHVDLAPTSPQYRKSSLTPQEADRLLAALDREMESARWYREADLTLGMLATRLRVPPQTLSQALNQRVGQSLTEYLTDKRIRDAKALILDPSNDCFTVEGLARQAGFASRSAFYKAFRLAEGVTPVEYRRLNRHAPSETASSSAMPA